MPHDQPVVEVRAADGHRFELIDVCPPRVGRTMLLLPGLGVTARHCIRFARQLAAGGTRVLIHEWRGAGSSSTRAAAGGDWGYHELIELDLDAALSRAGELAEREPVWLAGHSLGSQLACIIAARRPEAAAGLILIAGGAPYARVFPWPMRLVLGALLRLFPWLSGRVGHFPGRRVGFAGSEAHGVMRDWSRTGRTGRYDLDTLSFPVEHALTDLGLPVLTVRMAADWFVPEASLEWLLGKMPEARVTRAIVTSEQQGCRADHFRWMKSPEATAARIDDWFADASY